MINSNKAAKWTDCSPLYATILTLSAKSTSRVAHLKNYFRMLIQRHSEILSKKLPSCCFFLFCI